MIKGINRQVVEVSDTGSEYFEKIMFFVKPEYISLSEGKIKEYAGKIAATSSAPPKAAKHKTKGLEFLKVTASVLLGSAITLLMVGVFA